MYRFKDENKNKTLGSIRKFPGENAPITVTMPWTNIWKCGAEDINALLDFQRKYLYEDFDIKALYPSPHHCSGFTAHNGTVDEETAFRLLHENHIHGDENYTVVFNLTKRTAAVQFAPDFAETHRYQL